MFCLRTSAVSRHKGGKEGGGGGRGEADSLTSKKQEILISLVWTAATHVLFARTSCSRARLVRVLAVIQGFFLTNLMTLES
jgi:hypothetical protein